MNSILLASLTASLAASAGSDGDYWWIGVCVGVLILVAIVYCAITDGE